MCVCARVFLWRKLLSSAVDKVLFYYAYIGRHASLGAKINIYIYRIIIHTYAYVSMRNYLCDPIPC